MKTINELRYDLMNRANEKTFFIQFQGVRYPAQVQGYKMQWPYASDKDGEQIEAQISWALVERIADGISTVIYTD